MRTEQEIVDSRIVMRSLCGALAVMGVAAMAYRLHPVAIGRTPFDYWLPVSMAGFVLAAGLLTIAAPWLMQVPALHGVLAALGCQPLQPR